MKCVILETYMADQVGEYSFEKCKITVSKPLTKTALERVISEWGIIGGAGQGRQLNVTCVTLSFPPYPT